MAGLLNINELGHMLRPRLRNNGTITLSRRNRDFVFCLVNMSYSPAGPKEFIEFISPIVSSLCCACETDIVLKFKNSSDVPIKPVEGKELSEAGELVEIALEVTFNLRSLPFICKNCYQFISNTEQKPSKNKEEFGKISNQTEAKYFRKES